MKDKWQEALQLSADMLSFGDSNHNLDFFICHISKKLAIVRTKEGKFKIVNKLKWIN